MADARHTVLIVSADDLLADEIGAVIKKRGWVAEIETDVAEAVAKTREVGYGCIITVDTESRGSVRDVLTGLSVGGGSPVIAVVNANDVKTAVDAMKLGANAVVEVRDGNFEPIKGPLVAAMDEVVPKGSAPLLDRDPRDVVIRAKDSPLNELLEMLAPIANANAPVMITGESGTGKELFARTIHNMSPRREKPFIAVNCGAIPESLLESELFGFVKGAFTGAHADKVGYFEAANEGTIFLDEIGEMPARLQVKILRVLQERVVSPVGSSSTKPVDFRVITATNRNLEAEIKEGDFREDLYYRIAVLPLHLPALRERPNDIVVLADYFLEQQNRVNETTIQGITVETYSHMKRYDWPGNIRELENLIQRLAILKRAGFIERDDLPPQISGSEGRPQQLGLYVPSEGMDMAGTLEKLESHLLASALKKAGGNKAQAARLLGLNRTTLVEKLKRLQIDLDNQD